jgi:hypothetical protein
MEISTFFLAGMVGAYGVLWHIGFLLFQAWGYPVIELESLEEEEEEDDYKPFSIKSLWSSFNYAFGSSFGHSFGYVAIYSLLSYWLVGQWATWDLSITEIKYNGVVIHTPTMILFALLSAAAGIGWIAGKATGDIFGSIFSHIFQGIFGLVEFVAAFTPGRENKENTAGVVLFCVFSFVALVHPHSSLPVFFVSLIPLVGMLVMSKLDNDQRKGMGIYKMGVSEWAKDKLNLNIHKWVAAGLLCMVIVAIPILFIAYLKLLVAVF